MALFEEVSQAAAQQKLEAERKQNLADTKPTMSMLHHMQLTRAGSLGFVITLLDGTKHRAASTDFMFTDGLSIVADNHRIYIPLTSVVCIVLNNPGD